jgi:hypothetical protein
LERFGPIRVDCILGRLSGYHWVYSANSGFAGSWTEPLGDQPFIVGQKISFKPSANLELGIGMTALAGSAGVPFTGNPGTPSDPGDHCGGFDCAYRIPKAKDWLAFYADAWFFGPNQATLAYRRIVTDQSLLKGGNVHDVSGNLTSSPCFSLAPRAVNGIRDFPNISELCLTSF